MDRITKKQLDIQVNYLNSLTGIEHTDRQTDRQTDRELGMSRGAWDVSWSLGRSAGERSSFRGLLLPVPRLEWTSSSGSPV